MKKTLCITMTVFFFLMAGCATTETTEKRLDMSLQSGNSSVNTTFVSGMGCNDQNCTDASHHHDCPADCTDYDHYHNCALDCHETSHHHGGETAVDGHGKHHGNNHH